VRFRGKTPVAASPSNNQAAAKAASTTSTAAAATGSKPARQAVTSTKSPSRPGKKEKVRFGQAPQNTLTSAQNGSAENGAASASAGAGTQTASSANPDVPAVNAGNSIGDVSQIPEKQAKTRFSQRPSVPKVKKPKGSSDDDNAPTQDELAAQKVQGAPLGLAPQPAKTKKKKEKGDKTRFTGKPKQPEQVQQPYMGGQQPVDGSPSTAAQPAAGNNQPTSTTPDGTQP
jgi:peptidyl-prolyl cis-trans isomerase SurA